MHQPALATVLLFHTIFKLKKEAYTIMKIPMMLIIETTSAFSPLMFDRLIFVSYGCSFLATHSNISSTLYLPSHRLSIAHSSDFLSLFVSQHSLFSRCSTHSLLTHLSLLNTSNILFSPHFSMEIDGFDLVMHSAQCCLYCYVSCVHTF